MPATRGPGQAKISHQNLCRQLQFHCAKRFSSLLELAWQFRSRKMFPGFRSRCMTPAEWMYLRARSTWYEMRDLCTMPKQLHLSDLRTVMIKLKAHSHAIQSSRGT